EFTRFADVQNASKKRHSNAGDDGNDPGGLEPRVHGANESGQETVAGHGPKDACLSQHHHEDDGGEAGNGTQLYEARQPAQLSSVRRGGNRVRHVEVRIRGDAGGDARDQDVKHGTNNQGTNNADGHIALRVFGFLRGGADGVKADVGKEHEACAAQNSRPTKLSPGSTVGRDKGMPVGRVEGADRSDDEKDNHGEFYEHDQIVKTGRFLDADDEHQGDHR